MTVNIMRHESVFNPNEHPYPVHIIGAGATGSRVFAALLELGVQNIHIYDDDIVEDHNLANQIYDAADISYLKVLGCVNFAKRKLGVETLPTELFFHARKVTGGFIADGNVKGGVVFILTDTMDSRRQIARALVKRCSDNSVGQGSGIADAPMLIIETRMGSTHGAVFTFNPFDNIAYKQWLGTLVDDTDTDSIELSPCGTSLSVGTTASLIANYAVWQMMNFFVDPIGLRSRIDLFFKPTLTVVSSSIAS
jgi:molybdopterin/thiamine biosynthesis adenylyltransferase